MEAEPPLEVARTVGPSVLGSAAQFGLFTGTTGAVFGGVVGLVRDASPTLFFFVSGIQCFTLGSIFYASRQSALIYMARERSTKLSDLTTKQKTQASCIGGGVCGFTTAAIFRGRRHLIPGSLTFAVLGYFGQQYVNYRDARALKETNKEPSNLWHRILSSKFSPLKRIPDDEYEKMLQDRLDIVSAELALVHEDMENIRSEQRDKNGE